MSNSIQKALSSRGCQLVQDPAALRDAILQQGGTAKEAVSVELVLTACPSVGALLLAQETSRAELNVLLASVVRETDLSPTAAREILGELLRACGKKTPVSFRLLGKYSVGGSAGAAAESEHALCLKAAAAARLDDESVVTRALADLENLSGAGNGEASYLLGKFYFDATDKPSNGQLEKGKPFFQLAQKQGYGPANGALAWYALKNQSMAAAISYYEHPASLVGRHGAEWSWLGNILLMYRSKNKDCYIKTLILSAASLLISLLAVWILGGGGSLVTLTLVLEGMCAVWCFVGRIAFPHISVSWVYLALTLCWFIQALCLL